MSAKHHERTDARRVALQALYQGEILGKPAISLANNVDFIEEEGSFDDYSLMLLNGIDSHVSELDEIIAAASQNWSMERMPTVDRCLLRLATYEMIYVDNVPVSVSINEAVDLAHAFGGEDESPRFVNGILGKIAKERAGE